jgi:hypothetical protein
LEDFLLDIYEHGQVVPEPEVMWTHGARDILVAILGCIPLTK